MNQENNQKNWNLQTIRNRFILCFVLFIFFIFILFAINSIGALSVSQNNNYVSFNLTQSQSKLNKLNGEINYANLLLKNQLHSPLTESYGKNRKIIWEGNIKQILRSVEKLRKEWRDIKLKEEYDKLVDKIKELQKNHIDLEEIINDERAWIMNSESQNKIRKEKSQEAFKNEIIPASSNINFIIKNLTQLIDKEIQSTQDIITDTKIIYNWIWYIVAFILIIIGFLVVNLQANAIKNSIKIIRNQLEALRKGNIPKEEFKNDFDFKKVEREISNIVKEMKKVQTLAEEVGDRNFQTELVIFNDRGDVGKAIAKMRVSLNELADEDERTLWVNKGLNIFNKIIRDTNETQALYDNIIKELVKYLGAIYGSIFIINDENQEELFLKLESVFAYDRKRFIEKNIKLGQGFVGQSWREKDTIYLREIPENYVTIKTGLGEAAPESLLIVPLIANDEVLGVVELASFKTFEKFEINFAKQVGSNIVSTIFSLKNGERTQRLLKEAQDTTKKMKKQEEVSIKNMEELVKTQENMKKNEIRLKAQTAAIDNALVTLEMDIYGKIINANINFLELFRYSIDEIKNQSYDIFVQNTTRKLPEYQIFWEQLQRGRSKIEETLLINKHGKKIWLNASFNPSKNDKGAYDRILVLASDITVEKTQLIEYSGQITSLNESQAVIDFDINGRINFANDIFLHIIKYDLEEILGKHHSVLLSESDKNSELYTNFWKKLFNGDFISGRFKYLRKDGKEVWLRGSYNPIKDASKEVYKVIHFAHDINEAIINENKIQQTNEMLRKQNIKIKAQNEENNLRIHELNAEIENNKLNIISLKGDSKALSNTLASATYDEYGFLQSANEKFMHLFEYSAEEILNQHHKTLLSDDIKESSEQKQLWIDLKIGKHQFKEEKYCTKSGEIIWLSSTFTPVEDEKGKVFKVLQLSANIHAEKTLKNIFEQNQIALNFSLGVIELDIYGAILSINDNYLKIFGYTKDDELIGKYHALFLNKKETTEDIHHTFWEDLRRGKAIKDTFSRVKKDGTIIRIDASYNPIIDLNGQIVKILSFATLINPSSN